MTDLPNTPVLHRRGSGGPGFDLRPSDDYMTLLLTCTLPPRTIEIIVGRIRNELGDLGISSEERIAEALARFEKAVPHGPQLEDVVLLEGMPPVPPIDESIRWSGNFLAKGFVVDPATGRADYRRKLADVSVASGQMLAEIIPGQPGKNGQDVFGRVVPPRAPRPVVIHEGKNVRFDPIQRSFTATVSGRIRFVGKVLSVDDVLHVDGSAGLRTGNINHPGALIVSRDIQSDTEVIATGDIDVGENIEDATVESSGNLTVQGGISCKVKGTINVAGNVHARFMRNATVEAGGDIYVDREINQCHIRTRGAVIVKSGRIVGGSIIALKGVETCDLGSDACIPTELTVGKDYTMEALIAEKKAAVESAKSVVLKLRDAVAPLRSKRESLSPPMRQKLAMMQEELERREVSFATVEKELNRLFRSIQAAASNQIYVHGKIYPDNTIQVGAQLKKIKECVNGPLRVGLKDGKLTFFRLKNNEGLLGGS
jgi:uncharacterized protein (DUF342 family)